MNKKLCLLITLLLLGFLNTFSQVGKAEKTISIQFSNLSLQAALNRFEQASGYTFFYDAEQVNLEQTVSMDVKQATVSKAVTELLKNTGLGFEIANLQITLFNKKAPAQQPKKEVRVTGVVSDDTGEPIIGANVTVQGTAIGAITDLNGHYTLNVPAGSTLVVSYIGYTNPASQSERCRQLRRSAKRRYQDAERSGGCGLWHAEESQPDRLCGIHQRRCFGEPRGGQCFRRIGRHDARCNNYPELWCSRCAIG